MRFLFFGNRKLLNKTIDIVKNSPQKRNGPNIAYIGNELHKIGLEKNRHYPNGLLNFVKEHQKKFIIVKIKNGWNIKLRD